MEENILSSEEEIGPNYHRMKSMRRQSTKDVSFGPTTDKKAMNIPSLIKWTANEEPIQHSNPNLHKVKFDPLKNYARFGIIDIF